MVEFVVESIDVDLLFVAVEKIVAAASLFAVAVAAVESIALAVSNVAAESVIVVAE